MYLLGALRLAVGRACTEVEHPGGDSATCRLEIGPGIFVGPLPVRPSVGDRNLLRRLTCGLVYRGAPLQPEVRCTVRAQAAEDLPQKAADLTRNPEKKRGRGQGHAIKEKRRERQRLRESLGQYNSLWAPASQ